MEISEQTYIDVELKPYYFNEFVLCGIPVPPTYINDSSFILTFKNHEQYISYRNLLKSILYDLQQADTENRKYEIQRSKAFIRNLLSIMGDQFSKKNN